MEGEVLLVDVKLVVGNGSVLELYTLDRLTTGRGTQNPAAPANASQTVLGEASTYGVDRDI